MAFDVKEYLDMVRLLTEHPEWKAELRRLLLTQELLKLPDVDIHVIFKEIWRHFPNQWVLIEFTCLDEHMKLVEGEVIAHSTADRDLRKIGNEILPNATHRREPWQQ